MRSLPATKAVTPLAPVLSHSGHVYPPSPSSVVANWRFQRTCFLAAIALTLLWGCVYLRFQRSGLIDEPGQTEVIYHFFFHRPGLPEDLPNLPGYHFLVLALTFGHPSLTSARVVTLVTALVGLFAFSGAWRRLHGQPSGAPTLLFALLPILQPYTAMVYTDPTALAFLLLAFWAYFARHSFLCAVFFLLACLVRQTCLVWVAYLVVLEFSRVILPSRRPVESQDRWFVEPANWSTAWRRTGWLLGLLAVSAGAILYAGRLTLGHAHGNKFEPNLATLHFGGVLLVLLGLPLIVLRGPKALQAWANSLRSRPTLTSALTLASLATVFVLGRTFGNPHPWNQSLYWLEAPSTFTMLRNWPLIYAEVIPGGRFISSTLLVGSAAGLAWLVRGQRFARELWLALPFALALLLSNNLVEPRYFITPLVILLLFLDYELPVLRWQIRWFAVLCLFHAPFILDGLSLW